MTRITRMRVDSRETPLAVGSERPRFSWAWESGEPSLVQTGYRVVVDVLAATGEPDATVWESPTRRTDETLAVAYEGADLLPGRRYRWRVEATTNHNDAPVASEWANFTTAPAPQVWDQAQWITIRRHDYQHDDHRPLPHLRRLVVPRGPVARATLHTTAGGIHQVWIAGHRVGESPFGPGWTDYDTRVAFHTHDVTEFFADGAARHVGAVVADGWYAGGVGPYHRRNHWGKHPVWRAVLVLEYADGSAEEIRTDGSWEGAFGAIQSSDLLQGEVVDARADLGDWTATTTPPVSLRCERSEPRSAPVPASEGTTTPVPPSEPSTTPPVSLKEGSTTPPVSLRCERSEPRSAPTTPWRPVTVEAGPTGELVPAKLDPPAPFRELPAREVTEPVAGSFVVDFGQNFAGHVRLRVPEAAAGTIIRVRHGETLDTDGTLYVANLRGARATDTFIHAGPAAVFEPEFTYHGFRYAEITGYPGAPAPDAVTGVALSSIGEGAGSFECSSQMVNRLHSNIDWSMRSNFFDIPTDCPNRDERLGWTGDAQIFAPTSTYHADVVSFFDKWIDDVLDASLNGIFPDIAPGKVMDRLVDGSSGYAEVGLVVPWLVHERFGDSRLIERVYDAGAAWVKYVRDRTDGLVWRRDRNIDYGDWLAPVETPKELTATAYFALSVQLMARFAAVLGRQQDLDEHEQLAGQVAAAFREAFVEPEGTMPAGTQAAYTLALDFGLLLPEQRPIAAAALAADIEARGGLSTGFLSVARLLPTLSRVGRSDLAYRLLLNEEYPSWGHQIRHGATSIWERWDGWRPETGFQDPLMNSFNHFALGSVGEWLFSGVGGITPEEPGYRRIRIAPQVGGLEWAKVAHESVSGPIRVEWHRDGSHCRLEVHIPANTTAVVELPFAGGGERELGSGRHVLEGESAGPVADPGQML